VRRSRLPQMLPQNSRSCLTNIALVQKNSACKANAPFILVITNKDTEEEEFEMASLRIEKIIPGGKTLQLKMPALKPGTYEFIGDFHEKTAKGRIVAE
jgi:hypothetical protein